MIVIETIPHIAIITVFDVVLVILCVITAVIVGAMLLHIIIQATERK